MRILPRLLGKVLSDAMGTLARTWKPLILLAVVVFVPASLITIAAFSIPGALDFVEAMVLRPEELADLPPEVFLDRSRPFLLATAITMLVQGLATIFVFVACHRATVADLKDETTRVGATARAGLRRYPVAAVAGVGSAIASAALFFFGLTFWSVPAVTVGTPNAGAAVVALVLLVALVGPGLWLGTSLSMVTAAAAVEGKGVLGAMRRSARLVRGRWWATFGFLLLVGLLGTVAVQLVQLVAIPVATAGGGGSAPLASLLGVLAQGPIVTAMGITFTHWYVDLRARNEALVLDQL